MVKKILTIFNREFTNTNEAALLLGLFSLLSQFIGLLRDRSFAHMLGPSASLDTYYAAFRIPDFLYASIASLASITVLLPFLTKRLHGAEGERGARVFMRDIFTAFFLLLVAISIGLFIAMPWLAKLIAPGFTDEAHHTLVFMSRIMLVSPIIFGISNMYGSVTQLYKKFFVYAIAPVFYNLGIIIGIFVFFPHFGLAGLAYGVVLGAALHFLVQLPVFIQHKFVPTFHFPINWIRVREVVTLSLPRTLALSLSQLSMLALVALTSYLKEGSISIFSLSYNLETTTVMIVGISYAVASFPILSSLFTKGEKALFSKHIFSTARSIIFWSIPMAVLFIVLRAQIVRVVFGSGAFSWSDTKLTAAALALFAISVAAQSLVHLFVRAFYAAGNTTIPFLVNLASALITVGTATALVAWYHFTPEVHYFIESLLRVDGISGTDILMVPLGFSIGSIANCLLLGFFIHRRFGKTGKTGIGKTLLHVVGASVLMGASAYAALSFFGTVFDLDTFVGIFAQGALAGIIGTIIAALILFAVKNEEFLGFLNTVRTKFWKVKIVVPEQSDL